MAKAEIVTGAAQILERVQRGDEGAWFSLDALRKCVVCESERIVMERELREYRKRASATGELDSAQAVVIEETRQQLVRARSDLADAKLEIGALQTDLSAWYRNPITMWLLGAACGATGAALLITLAR